LWLAPRAAEIVRIEEADRARILHVHFLDPPSEDLRTVIHTLQVESERDSDGGAAGAR
jgi:hypothetical protein